MDNDADLLQDLEVKQSIIFMPTPVPATLDTVFVFSERSNNSRLQCLIYGADLT